MHITRWRISSEGLEGGHLFFTLLFGGKCKQSGKEDSMRVMLLMVVSPFLSLRHSIASRISGEGVVNFFRENSNARRKNPVSTYNYLSPINIAPAQPCEKYSRYGMGVVIISAFRRGVYYLFKITKRKTLFRDPIPHYLSPKQCTT